MVVAIHKDLPTQSRWCGIDPLVYSLIVLEDCARVLQTYVVNFIGQKVQHFQADSKSKKAQTC